MEADRTYRGPGTRRREDNDAAVHERVAPTPAGPYGQGLSSMSVLALQRGAGNAAVTSILNRSPRAQHGVLQREYDDRGLRAADPIAADVLREALGSGGGAGVLLKDANDETRRFNLIVTVNNEKKADYYGYTDVVYRETQTSFLFSGEKLQVERALAGGLDLMIVINLAHARTTGQRLSTLVHEFGVHGTRVWSAMSQFNRYTTKLVGEKGSQKMEQTASVQSYKEILETHLNSHAYDANMHHEEFGGGQALDYKQLKDEVGAALGRRTDSAKGFDSITKLVGLGVIGTDWAAINKEFEDATARGEKGHFKQYVHPKLELEGIKKAAKELEISAADFNARSKAQSGIFTSFSKGIGSLFGGGTADEKGKK